MGGVGPGPIKIPVGGYTVRSIPQAEVIGCVESLEMGGEVEGSGLSWGTLYGIGLKCMARVWEYLLVWDRCVAPDY